MDPGRYPPDPHYGTGAFRRRIRSCRHGDRIESTLNDNHHSMACRMTLDGDIIVGVEGQMARVPLTTCAGAPARLQEFVGSSVHKSAAEWNAGGRALHHCTHLFDMALIAIEFAASGAPGQRIDIVIPDAPDGLLTVIGYVDDVPRVQFTVEQDIIIAPEQWAGRHVKKGFVSWARTEFSGLDRTVALMMQKALMVAEGWPYIIDGTPGRAVVDDLAMAGLCYSYGEPIVRDAREQPHVADFSAGVIETDFRWP